MALLDLTTSQKGRGNSLKACAQLLERERLSVRGDTWCQTFLNIAHIWEVFLPQNCFYWNNSYIAGLALCFTQDEHKNKS